MDDSVEVFWDHDSPTPAAWRLLQGPSHNDEDVHCSPQLPRTKRLTSRPRVSTDNYTRYEESRKEVDQIINALRRASRDCETATSNVGKRLIIPELPEEEESEDERQFDTVPFQVKKPLINTSMDLLFDMSGNGEELASTAKSTNKATLLPRKSPYSPSADAWTDDDLFADDSLMLEVDNASIPTKSMKMTPGRHSTAQKSSTPVITAKSGHRMHQNDVQTSSTSNAKGFLDFFMDEGRPTKPSPQKEKKVLPQKNNYKFVPKSNAADTRKSVLRNSTSSQNVSSSTNSKPVLSNGKLHNVHSMTVVTKASSTTNSASTMHTSKTLSSNNFNLKQTSNKPAIQSVGTVANGAHNSSIPPEVLEELIMEDSWTEDENQEISKNSNSTSVLKHKPINATAQNLPNTSGHRNTSYKFTRSEKVDLNKKSLPQSKPTTSYHSVTVKNNSGNRRKSVVCKDVSSDGFSSEDDDMLLEAVAITESQQSSSSKGSSQGISSSNKSGSTSLPAQSTKQSNKAAPTSSQPKCSALEIERKKKLAMERRMQRLKQNQFKK
uniref:uncharacterized protein LOC120327190 n=1 Tax=Styela clava TaxID=7725 RepID=UPI00193951AE|nr:uncharacterized protein LOC120327190 [Styela clava]